MAPVVDLPDTRRGRWVASQAQAHTPETLIAVPVLTVQPASQPELVQTAGASDHRPSAAAGSLRLGRAVVNLGEVSPQLRQGAAGHSLPVCTPGLSVCAPSLGLPVAFSSALPVGASPFPPLGPRPDSPFFSPPTRFAPSSRSSSGSSLGDPPSRMDPGSPTVGLGRGLLAHGRSRTPPPAFRGGAGTAAGGGYRRSQAFTLQQRPGK